MQIDTFGIYVRAELDHWGFEFALHRDVEYLGYASRSVLQMLIDHRGEMPELSKGYKPLETDSRAQKIEDIVTAISRTHRSMAICLRGYYCARGRRRVERYETALMLLTNAGEPVMSATAYLDLSRRGEERVRGILEGLAMAA
ncbi:hypothetical protein MNO14_04995 [Luteimonas sp. S4-F44]|uniref:hypothetical protein n=1 Tax=Luteimonas sp. S4-F44 TaxID=2925842 RepID=UPI001F52FEF6|nr:hypothetical protein [Luteimonas sp. S4-F44]UNK43443.1 hypothetical protein MNO14_04995 [Luteimonas sp. S4-F44]